MGRALSTPNPCLTQFFSCFTKVYIDAEKLDLTHYALFRVKNISIQSLGIFARIIRLTRLTRARAGSAARTVPRRYLTILFVNEAFITEGTICDFLHYVRGVALSMSAYSVRSIAACSIWVRL